MFSCSQSGIGMYIIGKFGKKNPATYEVDISLLYDALHTIFEWPTVHP